MSILAFAAQRISSKTADRHLGRSVAGVVLSLLVTSAFSQTTTPAVNVPASATVVTPLTIGSATPLNFGAFSPKSAEGKVTIPPSGPRSGENVSLMPTNTGTAATINVAGDPNLTVTLNLPASPVTLSAGSSSVMTVNTFTTNLVGNTQLLPSGMLSFQMGATLTVNPGQATGTYSGVVPITVSYQ
jgi:hypothetical protein